MAFAPQGLERIGDWKRRIGAVPLVAIGGLNPERAKLCLQAGADVVSVVTDITLNADPEARAREWIPATRRRDGTPIALTIAGSDSAAAPASRRTSGLSPRSASMARARSPR